MVLGLRFAVFQSENQSYLSYVHEEGTFHGFLQFSGEEIVSPYVKFKIESAKTQGNNGLVHIRSCYNKKYWVAKPSQYNYSYISAGADEPNEDRSEFSCTLFEPIPINGDGGGGGSSGSISTSTNSTFRFRHVHLDQYLCHRASESAPNRDLLVVHSLSTAGPYDFHVRDWESQLILPKYIALKGDNGLYLSACLIKGHRYLKFASNDIRDPTVVNEVVITKDGSIHIKNDKFGKFWRLTSKHDEWIWADFNDATPNNLYTLFSPVKVGENIVALRNLGNNKFCQRRTRFWRKNCLKANVTTVSKEASLVVEEPVSSREIYDINFRILDARIYDQNIIPIRTESLLNRTQCTQKMKIPYKNRRSSTLNASASLKLGVNTTVKVSSIPVISDGKAELKSELIGSSQWGKTVSTENGVETEYAVPISPMTRKVTISPKGIQAACDLELMRELNGSLQWGKTVSSENVLEIEFTVPPMSGFRASLEGIQATCDVPFSYWQRDTLMNGQHVVHKFDDGIYTGINCSNLICKIFKEKL